MVGEAELCINHGLGLGFELGLLLGLGLDLGLGLLESAEAEV